MRCCDCEFRNRCDETEKVLTSFVKCYKRDLLGFALRTRLATMDSALNVGLSGLNSQYRRNKCGTTCNKNWK